MWRWARFWNHSWGFHVTIVFYASLHILLSALEQNLTWKDELGERTLLNSFGVWNRIKVKSWASWCFFFLVTNSINYNYFFPLRAYWYDSWCLNNWDKADVGIQIPAHHPKGSVCAFFCRSCGHRAYVARLVSFICPSNIFKSVSFKNI